MQYIPWALAVVFFVAFLYERKRRREAEKREEETRKKHQAELIVKLEEVSARFGHFEETVHEALRNAQPRYSEDYPKGSFIEL